MIIHHAFSNKIGWVWTARLIVIISFFYAPRAIGQEHGLYFDSFKVKDGLPNNSVTAVTQDATGYIWIVTSYGLCRYDGTTFKMFKPGQDGNNLSFSDFSIKEVVTDQQGKLWVAANGLNLYHPETETFQKIPTGSINLKSIYCDSQNRLFMGSLGALKYFEASNPQKIKKINLGIDKNNLVNVVYEDTGHNLWVGTTKGIFQINFTGQKPNVKKFSTKIALDSTEVTTIVQDKNRDLWFGTRSNGIYRYTPQTNHFDAFVKGVSSDNCLVGNHVRKLMLAKDGMLWIGTQEGLSVLNTRSQRFYNFQHNSTDPHSLSQNSIYDIFQDNAGSVWIGTYFGGLNLVHLPGTPFKVFQNEAYKNSLSSNIISTIVEDTHHNFWIGTEAGGLNFWDKKTGRFSVFKNEVDNKNSLSSNLVKAIAIDHQGDVYIGTATGGLNVYHPATHKFEIFRYPGQEFSQSINGDGISSLLVTYQNDVLVGTGSGLETFSKTQRRLIPLKKGKYDHLWVDALFEDKAHRIWVGAANGIYQVDGSGVTRRIDFFDSADNHTPLNFVINCFQEDKSGRLWAGTNHTGLVLLDEVKHSFRVFTEKDGLAGNSVFGILQDASGNLWVSTDNGLSKFDIAHSRFQNLTVSDGLPDNQFNNGSYYKQNDSTFYFGTYNGLISFNPASIVQNKMPPKVVFSYIKLFNQPLKIEQEHDLLKGDLNYARELTFGHDQNVFTIGFAALNFIKSTKNRYAYRLTGFDRDWNYVDLPSATYTNLPAGDYQLLVKAANNDGLWNPQPTVLNIHILPAPWKTWWAYLIYLIIAGIITFYIRRFLRARLQLRQELFRERIEKEQEKKVYQQQLDFFTDVSHEIRTPLTLILGPMERLAAIKIDNEEAKQYINNVKNNAGRLYRLVTELLDFRKAGADQLHPYFTEDDLVKFLEDIFCAFQSTAEIKDIDFQFHADTPSLMVYFDPDQLEKVFNNLFINAVKFTQAGGWIRVAVHENLVDKQVQIIVEDNGKGIKEEDIEHIFENFYQAGPSVGTGIGLALSKRIVELHKGDITVTSSVEADGKEGHTAFTVTLMLGNEHLSGEQLVSIDPIQQHSDDTYIESEISDESAPTASPQIQPIAKRSILLVEDNDEVREFIKQSLENEYQVIEAKNGQEGLNYAIRLIPDLIISDVMMPIMDGFEFCSKIKTDIRTSHIPVILLTARTALEHHIQGLQQGADAYITKPFSTHVLHLNIHNMLTLIAAQQKKNNERLSQEEPEIQQTASEDEKFLYQLQHIIHQHMDNPDFDLIALTREVAMSKSALYRKFSALTNQSLNGFIKTERLKKAAKLFKEGETSILAVSVKVGFNDVKYFSKEFKKMHNVTPNEYLNCDEE